MAVPPLTVPTAWPDGLRAVVGTPFLLSADWWRCVCDAARPDGARPQFVIVSAAGRPACVVPLLREAAGGMAALTSPYTMVWQPVLADPAPDLPLADLMVRAGRAAAAACRGVPLLRLDALDTEWSGLAPLLSGLRRAGRVVQLFDHFGNWHDTLPHGSWPDYLAARPGRLRETIRRKTARAERDPALRLTMARTPSEVDAALPAYLEVYRRSWKEPEPYPRFDACLLPAAAAAGVLRLGVFWHAETPIAAQYWIVEHGTATVLKLAHDEQHKALSPGTVLTAWMIRHLIEAEAVRALDFGRGDDPYKADWVSRRRQRIGVIAADPFSPRGLAAIARHAAGRVLRRVR